MAYTIDFPQNILIPAAGIGKRMRHLDVKALSPVGEETILSRQLRILQKVFPKSSIIVVVGYGAKNVIDVLPKNVKWVENEQYDKTNVVRSLGLGLGVCLDKTLIVYGDLIFEEKTFDNMDFSSSFIISSNINPDAVGVNIINGTVVNFSFGLKEKWGQIAYLRGQEFDVFKKITGDKKNGKKFAFECLNDLLELNFSIKSVHRDFISEIDSYADLNRWNSENKKKVKK